MTLSEAQARELLALYRTGECDAPAGDAETYFSADELRRASVFKWTVLTAAIAQADGRPVEGAALEQMIARIYHVSTNDVREALEMFTEHVPFQDWVAAASDKHRLHERKPTAHQQATA